MDLFQVVDIKLSEFDSIFIWNDGWIRFDNETAAMLTIIDLIKERLLGVRMTRIVIRTDTTYTIEVNVKQSLLNPN